MNTKLQLTQARIYASIHNDLKKKYMFFSLYHVVAIVEQLCYKALRALLLKMK